MYKIYADDILIYDSTLEDYKIGKGSVTLEVGKSGSFTFSLYPEHPYYDAFVKLKTVITVYKRGRILFRGRILNDVTDYWNNKVITCEGELGFLQDSIIRPFTFQGSPSDFFKKMINEHNAQVDEFKKFKIGSITIVDSNDYIYRSNSGYESALSNLKSRLPESALGGYFYITHGADGKDPIPTLNYVADFIKTSSQTIEFGQNLTKYTKTVKGEEIATAIIPLGATVDEKKITISEVNNGVDYVYSESGVALYGWIFKVVEWEDVTLPKNLKTKATDYLADIIKQNITIEIGAVDLSLLDDTIESFNVCEYIRVLSTPHNFDSILLCTKQTIDLLNPSKDSYVLGHNYSTFTENSNKIAPTVTKIVDQNLGNVDNKIKVVDNKVVGIQQNIYQPGTTQIDGGKIYENSVTSKQVNYENIFAADINMTGRFLTTAEVYLNPGVAEQAELRDIFFSQGYSELYDFDDDGVISTDDLAALDAMVYGSRRFSDWSKAQRSVVSLEINLKDPDRAIRIYGMNMWGRRVEKVFGANSLFMGDDARAEFETMVGQSSAVIDLEERILTLENRVLGYMTAETGGDN